MTFFCTSCTISTSTTTSTPENTTTTEELTTTTQQTTTSTTTEKETTTSTTTSTIPTATPTQSTSTTTITTTSSTTKNEEETSSTSTESDNNETDPLIINDKNRDPFALKIATFEPIQKTKTTTEKAVTSKNLIKSTQNIQSEVLTSNTTSNNAEKSTNFFMSFFGVG